MGSGGSRPAGDGSGHIFQASGPVSFSPNVLNSLQDSPETDSTRARAIESHIQARVHDALSKIRDTEAQRLSELTSSLTPEGADDSANGSNERSGDQMQQSGSATPAADRTHATVRAEIDALKQKLDARRKLEKPSGNVEKVKDELVRCLRTNDRRPLDCWAEVEAFKREVGELERSFVERTLR